MYSLLRTIFKLSWRIVVCILLIKHITVLALSTEHEVRATGMPDSEHETLKIFTTQAILKDIADNITSLDTQNTTSPSTNAQDKSKHQVTRIDVRSLKIGSCPHDVHIGLRDAGLAKDAQVLMYLDINTDANAQKLTSEIGFNDRVDILQCMLHEGESLKQFSSIQNNLPQGSKIHNKGIQMQPEYCANLLQHKAKIDLGKYIGLGHMPPSDVNGLINLPYHSTNCDVCRQNNELQKPSPHAPLGSNITSNLDYFYLDANILEKLARGIMGIISIYTDGANYVKQYESFIEYLRHYQAAISSLNLSTSVILDPKLQILQQLFDPQHTPKYIGKYNAGDMQNYKCVLVGQHYHKLLRSSNFVVVPEYNGDLKSYLHNAQNVLRKCSF